MRVLLIQQAGHTTNFEFTESHSLQYNLREQGIESEIWGPGHLLFKQPFDVACKGFDMFLIVQNYFDDWMPDLSGYSKVFKIFWSIDSHIVPELHADFCKRNKIDLVLNAIESHSKYFTFTKTLWFPNAYADHLIKPIEGIEKVQNLGFCGSNRYPSKQSLWVLQTKEYINAFRFKRRPNLLYLKWLERSDWLQYLEQKCNLKMNVNALGNDMVRAVNSYKVHFNRNLFDDVNYRTFETLGCKTLLFTNRTENLERLFDLDRHLIVYSSKKDFIDKYKYYLAHPEKMNTIIQDGYDHLKSNHTYCHRVVALIEKVSHLL